MEPEHCKDAKGGEGSQKDSSAFHMAREEEIELDSTGTELLRGYLQLSYEPWRQDSHECARYLLSQAAQTLGK